MVHSGSRETDPAVKLLLIGSENKNVCDLSINPNHREINPIRLIDGHNDEVDFPKVLMEGTVVGLDENGADHGLDPLIVAIATGIYPLIRIMQLLI